MDILANALFLAACFAIASVVRWIVGNTPDRDWVDDIYESYEIGGEG